MASGRDDATVYERPPGSRPDGAARPAASEDRTDGRRYEDGAEIARGGMGRVVEATDRLLGRVVAVKEALTAEPDLLRRFLRETKITARLEHPSIVPLYDAGHVGDMPFYVMRRVSGRPLSQCIADAPELDQRLALIPHVLAAAHAVAHAHRRGIIHRDIKPSNILVGELGETVVIDWGLAKVVDEPDDDDAAAPRSPGASLRTVVGTVVGTPGFMAPEQAEGEPTGPASDVYALGATLYYVLARRPPTTGDDVRPDVPPVPLAALVPGVPPELATIAATALAGAAADRYPDAGAFAEELGRFLTGQVVASHRYTRAARLRRFVRRHRAAVGVAAAAALALAALGAVAITRVVAERDRADDQARIATARRTEAEAARAVADERAEQLLLLRARGLVESNPTAAIASLKQLAPTSARVADAHAIASSAVMRGVGWALEVGETRPVRLELDPTAARLYLVEHDGRLRIWDLDQRRRVVERAYPAGTRAVWALGGARLLVYGAVDTVLIDPAADRDEPVAPLPRPVNPALSADGTRLVGLDDGDELVTLDLASGELRRPWPGQRIRDVAIAGDGAWIAATTATRLAVFDRAGTELAHLDDRVRWLAASSAGRLAVSAPPRLLELEVAPGASWRELERPPGDLRRIGYRGERLRVVTDQGVYALPSRQLLLAHPAHGGGAIHELGDDFLLVASGEDRLLVANGSQHANPVLPQMTSHMRVATRPGHGRVAVLGDTTLTVLDLALPRALPFAYPRSARFVGSDTVLIDDEQSRWHWFDLRAWRARPIDAVNAGDAAIVKYLDSDDERALFAAGPLDATRLLEVPRGAAAARDLGPFEDRPAALIPGGGIVYGKDGWLLGVLGDAPPRRLVEVTGSVTFGAAGAHRFAAIVRPSPFEPEARLVRGDLRTGAIDTLDLPSAEVEVTADRDGNLLIGLGGRLARWDGASSVELARFDGPAPAIRRIEVVDGGAVVVLADGAGWLVELAPGGARHQLWAHAREPVFGRGGRTIAIRRSERVELVELPSRARWTTAIRVIEDLRLDLASDHRTLLEIWPATAWVWQLPAGSGDLAALTNAVEDDEGLVAWPWQLAPAVR